MKQQSPSKDSLCRGLYTKTGYVFAKSPAEIAAASGSVKIAMLGSNENLYPPSPAVPEAAAAALEAATPFTLNRVSKAAAVTVVADTAYRDNFIAHVREWRETSVRVSVGDVWENERFLAAVKCL
ncbi:MAG TPA: hypothetical protein O0X23_01970 [Methanocorpusculum sp.]|nr:hypothetical protein [Methanocorpusculum sp.]